MDKMSFRVNKRRSSSLNSNQLLSALRRRSSLTEQQNLQKRKELSTNSIFFILSGSPVFIFSYQIMLFSKKPFKELLMFDMSFDEFKTQLALILLSMPAWLVVILLTQFQLLFLWILPAVEREVVTLSGYKFRTRHTSFDSWMLISLLYLLGASIGLYNGDIVYVHWIGIMFVLSVSSVILQIYLFNFYESDSLIESSILGINEEQTLVSKVYFGRHLQPITFGIDMKMFITNRISLTLWTLYIISALYHQHNVVGHFTVGMLTCAMLQLIYVVRRQWFEYVTHNLDNTNDRMGFYRIWGVLVFLPTIYLTPITYLSQVEKSASSLTCGILFIVGLLFQYLNTNIDLQKFNFRMVNGAWKIGNKDPFYIEAKYREISGESSTNILLGSGYWGKARHLNYTTEFLTFLAWSLTTNFDSAVNYFPVLFLACLLYERMQFDETRCLTKYTYNWIQYVLRVPYLIIPGVI